MDLSTNQSLPTVPLLLLALWAGLLFGGFAFGQDPEGIRRMPVWTRMASSATLVILAWYLAWLASGSQAQGYALAIALGMSLGFLGDLFMAELLPVSQRVLWGMAAFGLGHLAYIAGMVGLGRRLPGFVPVRWDILALWLLVGGLLCYWIVLRGQERTVLHWAALPYALLLASTAGLATGLALQDIRFAPLVLGAALFLISDLILATQLFNGARFPLIGDVIWLTYGPGQMLIVTSIWPVLKLVQAAG